MTEYAQAECAKCHRILPKNQMRRNAIGRGLAGGALGAVAGLSPNDPYKRIAADQAIANLPEEWLCKPCSNRQRKVTFFVILALAIGAAWFFGWFDVAPQLQVRPD